MLYIFTKSTKNAGGSRQRAFLVADFLKTVGYESTLVVPPAWRADTSRTRARLQYLRTIFSLRKRDVVLLQNPIFSTYFIVCIALVKILFRPTIVFDFDDATWVQNPIAPKALSLFADKFIVASHYLAKWSWIRGKPVLLMPNLVDYTLAEKYYAEKYYDKVVLGWIGGGPNSINNLKILIPVFEELVSRQVPFVFKLVGVLGSKDLQDMFIATGAAVEFVDKIDWGEEGEIQKANSSFDVGLCPLVDNESNKARCSLKVLDYMAASIPVVASPVGENKHFLEGETGGFLPSTTEEWIEDLEKLITNSALREEKGKEAKERLVSTYSYQANIPNYVEFLGLKN